MLAWCCHAATATQRTPIISLASSSPQGPVTEQPHRAPPLLSRLSDSPLLIEIAVEPVLGLHTRGMDGSPPAALPVGFRWLTRIKPQHDAFHSECLLLDIINFLCTFLVPCFELSGQSSSYLLHCAAIVLPPFLPVICAATCTTTSSPGLSLPLSVRGPRCVISTSATTASTALCRTPSLLWPGSPCCEEGSLPP